MRSKVFLKFVITYSIVLLVPFILMGIFVYTRFVYILTSEVKNTAINSLIQTRDVMDSYIDELNSISARIDSNPKIRSLLLSDTFSDTDLYPKTVDAINELRNYKTSNNMIESIMVIYKDLGLIISDSSKYDLNSFFKYHYQFEESDYEIIKKHINNAGEPVLLGTKSVYSNSNSFKIISFIRALPLNIASPGKALLITINEPVINNMIRKTNGNYPGSVFIFDSSSNVIENMSIGDNTIPPATALNITKNLVEDNSVYTLDGTDYIISRVSSLKTGLVYVSFIESKHILSKVEYVKNTTTEAIILIAAAGLLLVFLFARSSYRNVKSIADFIRLIRKKPLTDGRNEWELIKNTISNFKEENELLNLRLEEQIPVMRNNFYVRLLKGKFNSEEEINEKSLFLDIRLENQKFIVLAISIDYYTSALENVTETANREIYRIRMTNDIISLLCKIGNCTPVEIDPDNINLILSVPSKHLTDADIIAIVESGMKELLQMNKGAAVTAGISNPYDRAQFLSNAYEEALKALDYRIIKGSNSVILYSEAQIRSEDRYYYNFIQEKQILSSLRAGDFKSIQEILIQIVQSIKNSRVSADIAKCIYFAIVNTALKSLNELELDKAKVRLNLPNLVKVKTLDEVYSAVCLFYKDICDLVQKTKHTKSSSLLDNAIDYINKNCSNSMLSVEAAAEALSVSPSYLSRVFKEQSGTSFVDYVHIVRLANAKRLLSQSDSNVAFISDAVGYGNVRNFIRVFKKYEGVTPTEYRLSQSLNKNCNYQ